MFKRIKHVHFVGIGGIGMSGIAEVLLTLGYRVTGSDLKTTRVTEALVRSGAEIFSSHGAKNVAGAHVVVRSSAVGFDNEELLESEALKIPIISRAEMLAELARLKYTIAVAGTHGKTTTTSMIATILDLARMDPTYVIGGKLNTVGRNARLGKGEFIVLEADESDGSFLMLSPTIAVITNVEADHLDHYSGLPDIQDSFVAFANKVPFYGTVVLPSDSVDVGEIFGRIKRRILTFGTHEDANVRILESIQENLGSRFRLQYNSDERLECTLQLPGEHNVLNAAAAFAATYEMGVDPKIIAKGLGSFGGVERRFQVKATEPYVVVDDYAHHPTEVRATLAAARSAGFRRILAAFQPHRYSRTFHLFEDFVHAFDDADVVLIADIYPAGESPIEGVTSTQLVERLRLAGKSEAYYVPKVEEMEAFFRQHVRSGDAILIMGAGNITVLADRLSEAQHGKLEIDKIKVSEG